MKAPRAVEAVHPQAVEGALRPSCPGLYTTTPCAEGPHAGEYFYNAAVCDSMRFDVECHLSTGFVTCTSRWTVPKALLNGKASGSCLFAMPLANGLTVTGITARSSKKCVTSAIVPLEDTTNFKGKSFGRNTTEHAPEHPDVFCMTVPNVAADEVVDVCVTYFHPLEFENGAYAFTAPSTMPEASLPWDKDHVGVCSFTVAIRSAYEGDVAVASTSHPLQIIQQQSGFKKVRASAAMGGWKNADFKLTMPTWAEHIVAACVQQRPTHILGQPPPRDPRSSFVVALAPPKPERCLAFGRSVVFVIDRSGSMNGEPMEAANEALTTGLWSLTEHDYFNICAFDDGQEYFDANAMTQATPKNVERAMAWMKEHCVARYTTDIYTPLSEALKLLAGCAGNGTVPFVFLITDGAVSDEKEICKMLMAESQQKGEALPRVCTFGIGQYCNHYFLKMLANIGRGLSDAAFTNDKIATQMSKMLTAARSPVLTNIEIGVGVGSEVELYPFPVPDLYLATPVMVSGKVMGVLPPTISIRGRTADGGVWEQTVAVQNDDAIDTLTVPLEKVFVKQRIDLLVAKAWLYDDKKLEKEIIDISVEHDVACPYTKLCAFEVTPANEEKMKKDKAKGKKSKIAMYAVGGAAGILVLGAAGAMIGFGNIAGTLANGAGVVGSAGEALAGVIGNAGSQIGEGCCTVCDVCGDTCGDACGFATGLCQPCLDACAPITGVVGDACGSICGACQGLPDCLGGACGSVVPLLNGCCENCGECVGAVGPLIGDCCKECGGVIEPLGKCLLGIVISVLEALK